MNLKSTLPHLLAVGIFLLLTAVIYHPLLFNGKNLYQHDMLQSVGASKQLIEYRDQTGEEVLWMHTMFGGMPAYLNGTRYTGDLLIYAYRALALGLPSPAPITFLSFISFYILLLAFGVRSWLALSGAILFGLNGFSIISLAAGHNSKIVAVAFMPLVLAGIRLAFSNRRWLGISLTALALGLQIRGSHPQITYYLLVITIIYGSYELINALKKKRFKPFIVNIAGLSMAAVLAVGANAGKLYQVYEYGKYSTRGAAELTTENAHAGLDYEYVFRFSNGIAEPLVMFYPNIMGGSFTQKLSDDSNTAKALMKQGYSRQQAQQHIQSFPTYWGDQPLTAPYYAGSMLLFLLILALIVLPKNQKIWLILVAVLGIMLSWGKNFPYFNKLMFDYLPFYNKFRSVTFTIILPILAFNLLAFMGLEKWLKEEKIERFKALKWSVIIASGVSLFLIILAGILSYKGSIDAQLPDWLIGALRDDRKMLFRKDVFRTLIFTMLAAGILWAYHKKMLSARALVLFLAGLVMVDILPLSKRFLNKENFQNNPNEVFFKPTPADSWIMANSRAGERVLNLQNPWNEARTSYHHESVGGYHGAKMHRYQDLIDRYLANQSNAMITTLQAESQDFSSMQVLNMLNTKFLVAGHQKEEVFTNPSAFGNAWIVKELVTANSPDEVMDALGKNDLTEKAIINTSEFEDIHIKGSGKISLTSKTPNKVNYQANISGGNALAVFSEVYYPKGWFATIDGKNTEILRANYILRALEIPEGNHMIEFVFQPKSYTIGNRVTLISGILLALLLMVGVIVHGTVPNCVSV